MSQKYKAKLTFYICEIRERGNIRNEKEAACIIYKEGRDMHVEINSRNRTIKGGE